MSNIQEFTALCWSLLLKIGDKMIKRIKKITKMAFVSLSLLIAKMAAKKMIKRIIRR